MKWTLWLRRFAPLIIILTLMVVAYFLGLFRYFTFENLQENYRTLQAFVAAHPIWTPLIFIGIYIVSVALSVPGATILTVTGGLLFRVPMSTIYVVIGATLGACIIFWAARYAIGDFFRKKAGKRLKNMEDGFRRNAWSYLLFLRFVPLFPFWLVNIAPAFFEVPFLVYLWTTALGIAPGVYVYTQAGSGLAAIFESGEEFSLAAVLNWELNIALIALGIFALIPIIIKKILLKKKR